MSHGDTKQGPSLLERVDLALASRLAGAVGDPEPLAVAQRVLDAVRRPAPADATFVASLLRLRGFVVDDDDASDVMLGRPTRLGPLTQEHRMLVGLGQCLALVRQRAAEGAAPDGWFLAELFRTMTRDLPRFRNNDLRRGPPWDAQLYLSYPAPEQLHGLLGTFDLQRSYRDQPMLFANLHPVRQGFRLLWRFARIAPFPDFNLVMAWLGMNAWLQTKGYPLVAVESGDQELLARLVSGPPPIKIVSFESRLLRQLGECA
ncbi:MAG: hypothetical protein JNK78_17995 [Planctomycetes bacterium]|nr:hypothetical protein [Planctomycetota bacterium]